MFEELDCDIGVLTLTRPSLTNEQVILRLAARRESVYLATKTLTAEFGPSPLQLRSQIRDSEARYVTARLRRSMNNSKSDVWALVDPVLSFLQHEIGVAGVPVFANALSLIFLFVSASLHTWGFNRIISTLPYTYVRPLLFHRCSRHLGPDGHSRFTAPPKKIPQQSATSV